jgi:heme exporter protein C
MKKLFLPAVLIVAAMFAYAPVLIVAAPTESTMGLVQKIFYFHVPSWFAMFAAAFTCGIASLIVLVTGRKNADMVAIAGAELAVVFGLIGLITGPLWGRKAWGVYWQWDAKLTAALVMWLIFVSYLLLRRFAGAGSEKLAATVALFGMANVPFVYWSVNIWRTVHPKTSVVPTLPPVMRGTFWWCVTAFLGACALMLIARVRLEQQRARLDALYLSLED